MVDAHTAGMGEVGPEHLDEGAEAMLDHAGGREGGNAPALAFLVEQVRWAAHGDRGQQLFLPTPGLAATTIRAHGDIGDQADLHARVAALCLGRGQPFAGQPLGEGVELHVLGMAFGEFGHGRVPGVAILLRPMLPARRGSALGEGGMQSFEATMVFQRLATVAAEGLETFPQLAAGGAEIQVQGAQQAQAQLGQRRPVDQLQLLQALGLPPADRRAAGPGVRDSAPRTSSGAA